MKPYKFTKVGNVYTYHYKFSDMRTFLTSKERALHLTKWDGRYKTFRGFVDLYTAPTEKLITFKVQHVEAFDGKFDPESVVNQNSELRRVFTFQQDMSVTSQLKTMDEKFNKDTLKWEALQIGDLVQFVFFTHTYTSVGAQELISGIIIDKTEHNQVLVNANGHVYKKHVGMITKI